MACAGPRCSDMSGGAPTAALLPFFFSSVSFVFPVAKQRRDGVGGISNVVYPALLLDSSDCFPPGITTYLYGIDDRATAGLVVEWKDGLGWSGQWEGLA